MGDFGLVVRSGRSTPLTFAAAALSLSLAIGANTAVLSLIDSVWVRALPVHEPRQLVTVSSDFALANGFRNGPGWSYAMWERFRRLAISSGSTESWPFESGFVWMSTSLNLAPRGEVRPVRGVLASGAFFETLGVAAHRGRTFNSSDDAPGGGASGPVAVISHRFWQRHFGSTPDIVGRRLHLSGVRVAVIGVTPPAFFGIEVGESVDVFVPLGLDAVFSGPDSVLTSRHAFVLAPMLRVKAPHTLAAAEAILNGHHREIAGPGAPRWMNQPYVLMPAAAGSTDRSRLRQRFADPLAALAVVVGCLLLIACTNIANVLLVRAIDRGRDDWVRRALGASAWSIARRTIAEGTVLALVGTLIGALAAVWASHALVGLLPANNEPAFVSLRIDWRFLGLSAAVGTSAVVLCAILPALRASGVTVRDALNSWGPTDAGGRDRLGGLLLESQVALSLVLVIAAVLFGRTFARIAADRSGMTPERVLVVDVDASHSRARASERVLLFHRLADAASKGPGTVAAAASIRVPDGSGDATRLVNARGVDMKDNERVMWNAVTPRWFQTYGVAVVAGREFADSDSATSAAVVLVSETFVRRFLRDQPPIGLTLSRSSGDRLNGRTIVGVVADAPYGTPREAVVPAVYLPLAQSDDVRPGDGATIQIGVRASTREPEDLTRSVAAILNAADPNLSFSFTPLAKVLYGSRAQEWLLSIVTGFIAVMALVVATLGIYGTTARAVRRRRPEIGVRLSLGASTHDLMWSLVRPIARLVGTGIVIGIGASLWLSRFVTSLLYGLDAHDPPTYLAAAALVAAIATIAGILPAFRAARLDPMRLLREVR